MRTLFFLILVSSLEACATVQDYRSQECKEQMIEQGNNMVTECDTNPVKRAEAITSKNIQKLSEEASTIIASPLYYAGYGVGYVWGKLKTALSSGGAK